MAGGASPKRRGLGYGGLIAMAIVLTPGLASANAGTPLMWASAAYLMIGNAVIGLVEGLLLARVFALPKVSSVGVMVVANYISAWAGYLLLHGLLDSWARVGIAWSGLALMAAMAGAYLFTVLAEYPFVALAIGFKDKPWKRAWLGSLLVQTVSYLLLVVFFWPCSSVTMATGTDCVDASELPLPSKVALYYLGSDGVYRLDAGADTPVKVLARACHGRRDRLVLRPSDERAGQWQLDVRSEAASRQAGYETVLADLQPRQVADYSDLPPQYMPWNRTTWFAIGPAGRLLVPQQEGRWSARIGFWSAEGITVRREPGEFQHLVFDTPLMSLLFRNPLMLPGDLLLFESVDTREICLYDPASRRLTVLAEGFGAAAILTDSQGD